jgi:hypothetical protein
LCCSWLEAMARYVTLSRAGGPVEFSPSNRDDFLRVRSPSLTPVCWYTRPPSMPANYTSRVELPRGIDWDLARALEEFIHREGDKEAGKSYSVTADGTGFKIQEDSVDSALRQIDAEHLTLTDVDTLSLWQSESGKLQITFRMYGLPIETNDRELSSLAKLLRGETGSVDISGTDQAQVRGIGDIIRDRIKRGTMTAQPLPQPARGPRVVLRRTDAPVAQKPTPAAQPQPPQHEAPLSTPITPKESWWHKILDPRGLVTLIVAGVVVGIILFLILGH